MDGINHQAVAWAGYLVYAAADASGFGIVLLNSRIYTIAG
jgi:hypothetical protein